MFIVWEFWMHRKLKLNALKPYYPVTENPSV